MGEVGYNFYVFQKNCLYVWYIFNPVYPLLYTCTKSIDVNILDCILKDITNTFSDANFLLCGDFNGRTGPILDYISCRSITKSYPCLNHTFSKKITEYDNKDVNLIPKGKELLDFSYFTSIEGILWWDIRLFTR